MEKLFDKINIKYFERSYLTDRNRQVKYDEKIFFDITIRHPDNKKAESIFTNGMKLI
jgi:hypothetical protein